MNIDRDLDRMIDCELEDWKARKHSVVFEVAGESDDVMAGELYVDGRPIRPLLGGGCSWVSFMEAKHVAERLGVSLQVA